MNPDSLRSLTACIHTIRRFVPSDLDHKVGTFTFSRKSKSSYVLTVGSRSDGRRSPDGGESEFHKYQLIPNTLRQVHPSTQKMELLFIKATSIVILQSP